VELTGLILGSAIAAGTPVLLAMLGEILAQRSGIVNLGLEGAMALGAMTTAWVQLTTGNMLVAIIAGSIAGALLGLTHATLTVVARIPVLASGLCLFFVGKGLAGFWGSPIVGRPLPGLPCLHWSVLKKIPLLGPAILSQDVLVYLAIAIAAAMWWVLLRTDFGLLVQASGENAEIARAEGVPVVRIRLLCVTVGGSLAGLAGAHIALGFSHTWLDGIIAGRGWVAIGLVILARWNPIYGLPCAYVFGGLIAIQLNAQAAGISILPPLPLPISGASERRCLRKLPTSNCSTSDPNTT
jgi:general nucleoside transport system permease protein